MTARSRVRLRVPFSELWSMRVEHTGDEIVSAYESGRCDAYTTDASALAAQRLRLSAPDDHIILPGAISKEPLASSVRKGGKP